MKQMLRPELINVLTRTGKNILTTGILAVVSSFCSKMFYGQAAVTIDHTIADAMAIRDLVKSN